MRRLATIVAFVLLAACSREASDITDPGSSLPDRSDDLVVRVDVAGGFVPVEIALSSIPAVSVYADGRVIAEGAQIEIYPQPAYPAVSVRRVTAEGLAAIRDAARRAGLDGPDRELGNDMVADAPTTTFTYVDTDATRHVVSAYALGLEGGEDPQLRARLSDFGDDLTGLEGWLPEDAVGPEEMYEPARMRVFVSSPREPADEAIERDEAAWPLDTPLSEFGATVGQTGFRCGVVEGDDLDALLPVVREATRITRWTSQGDAFAVDVRPMLPDERGCPDAP